MTKHYVPKTKRIRINDTADRFIAYVGPAQRSAAPIHVGASARYMDAAVKDLNVLFASLGLHMVATIDVQEAE